MRIIGHRGAAGLAPENSLAGLRLAHDLGLRAVEIDVRLSRDGIPVLLHDALLDRTTTATGNPAAYDYATLRRQARLENGEPLPSLQQVLELLADTGLTLYLELVDPAAATVSHRLAQAYLPPERLVISSFHHDVLRQLRTRDPQLRTMALFDCPLSDPAGEARACGADEAGLPLACIEQQHVEALHAAAIPVYVWTVNAQQDRERLEAMGVDGIFSDHPQ